MCERMKEEEVNSLIKYCKLQEVEEELLRMAIQRAKPEKMRIRDVLSEEGKETKRAFYLLEGQVNITVNLSNGQRAVLRQVGKDQLLNLEIAVTNWTNPYSIMVASSSIKYITFQEKQVKIMTSHIIPELQQKASLLEKEVGKRNRRIKEQIKKKKMEDNINKLILPEISMPNRKKSLVNIDIHATQGVNLQNLPIFSKQLKKTSRSSSLSVIKPLESRYSQLTRQQKMAEAASQNLMDHFQEYSSKFMQKKLQRLKSERSISLNEKELKEIDYSRNEKLFKQNLKNIVKRKLMFERKHFKILTNFKNDPKVPVAHHEGNMLRYEDQNPIDNYFLL